MKLKKVKSVWLDSNNIIHLPQISGDDHSVCGIASDEDDNGKCMTVFSSDKINCKECIRIISLYKNL